MEVIDDTLQEIDLPKSKEREDQVSVPKSKEKPVFSFDISSKSEYISHEMLKNRQFLAFEEWLDSTNIQAQVVKADDDMVVCNCVLDSEDGVFQTRAFPRFLFGHLSGVENGRLVLIVLKEKLGTSRVDVIDGRGVVDATLFENELQWKTQYDNFGKSVEGGIVL